MRNHRNEQHTNARQRQESAARFPKPVRIPSGAADDIATRGLKNTIDLLSRPNEENAWNAEVGGNHGGTHWVGGPTHAPFRLRQFPAGLHMQIVGDVEVTIGRTTLRRGWLAQ